MFIPDNMYLGAFDVFREISVLKLLYMKEQEMETCRFFLLFSKIL